MTQAAQRTACDRCHGQKLRCVRATPGTGRDGACVRCAKAKVSCVWGPSRRRQKAQKEDSTARFVSGISFPEPSSRRVSLLRPNGSETAQFPSTPYSPAGLATTSAAPQSSYLLSGDLDNSGFTNFNLGSGLLQPSRVLAGPASSAITSSPSQDGPLTASISHTSGPLDVYLPDFLSPSHLPCIETWQRQFNEEWAMLPPNNPASDTITQHEISGFMGPPHTKNTSSLDLSTIQRFAELNVELFAHAATVPKPPSSLSEPVTWKNKDYSIDKMLQLSHGFLQVLIKASLDRHTQVDHATILLILSCHQRLIDMYTGVFSIIQACLDQHSTTAQEDYVVIPDIKVGSFKLPDSSALQITLILQIARTLLQRMGAILKNIGPRSEAEGDTEEDMVTRLVISGVGRKENVLLDRIGKLRDTLIKLDIL